MPLAKNEVQYGDGSLIFQDDDESLKPYSVASPRFIGARQLSSTQGFAWRPTSS